MQKFFNIRAMESSDFSSIMEIQSLCFIDVVPESEESLSSKFLASPETCYVVVRGVSVIGYIISLPWIFDHPPPLNTESCQIPVNPDCLYLHDLAIAPTGRGIGAADALVQQFFVELKRLGLPRASLIAVQNSKKYWQRHGFQVVSGNKGLDSKLTTYGEGIDYMEYVNQDAYNKQILGTA